MSDHVPPCPRLTKMGRMAWMSLIWDHYTAFFVSVHVFGLNSVAVTALDDLHLHLVLVEECSLCFHLWLFFSHPFPSHSFLIWHFFSLLLARAHAASSDPFGISAFSILVLLARAHTARSDPCGILVFSILILLARAHTANADLSFFFFLFLSFESSSKEKKSKEKSKSQKTKSLTCENSQLLLALLKHTHIPLIDVRKIAAEMGPGTYLLPSIYPIW